MFVYFYWPQNSNYVVQAFHKQEKATEYVFNQIKNHISYFDLTPRKKKSPFAEYIGDFAAGRAVAQVADRQVLWNIPNPVAAVAAVNADLYAVAKPPEEKKKETVAAELEALITHLDLIKDDLSIDNTRKAMELFDEYSKYILRNESLIHELNEIKVVD